MEQLTLPLSYLSYNLEDFIVSECNNSAYNIIMNWQGGIWGVLPYRYFVIINGPKSSGKTHISKIWQSLSNAIYIKTNELCNIDILQSYNAFIIEDIEKWHEEKLLHYINILNETKKYTLLTTSINNKDIILPDLSSRINSILRINITQPDDILMEILIFKYFSNSYIVPAKNIIKFLINRLPRHFNKILYILDQINNFALRTKRNININLIQEVLEDRKLSFIFHN